MQTKKDSSVGFQSRKKNKQGIDKKQCPYLQFNSNSYIIGMLKGDLQ